MSCMSAYSMPLWIIFTKWPAPSVPTWVTHGSPSATAAIDARIGPERLVGLGGATGHDRGAVQGALLAAGDPGADEVQSPLAQRLLAADGVVEVGVAAVDDDVALLEQLGELVDDRVGPGAGLDHDDRGARARERGDEVVDVLAGHEAGLGMLVDERVGPLGRAVVDRDRVALPAGEVAGQVGAHHRQPDDADVRPSFFAHAGLLTVSCLGTPARGMGVRMIGAIILGLLAGFIGKALMPGKDPGGLLRHDPARPRRLGRRLPHLHGAARHRRRPMLRPRRPHRRHHRRHDPARDLPRRRRAPRQRRGPPRLRLNARRWARTGR